MRTIGLFSIGITLVVVGIAAWSASTHSAVKAEPPQIDPLSLEAVLWPQFQIELLLARQIAVAP